MNATGMLLGALGCALALAVATPARAQAAGRAPAGETAAADSSADWPSWIQQLDESAGKVRKLRRISAGLETDVGRALSRRYPRGAEKEKLLAARDRAQADLADAEASHAELLEQARQAGVPQGLLQDYEEVGELPASDD